MATNRKFDIQNKYTFLIISILLMLFGAIVRCYDYIYNKPLDIMEAMISLNLINKSFYGIFHKLDYYQSSPFGFKFLEKIMVILFGISEFSLRFVPLLAGVLSLYVYYKIAKNNYSKLWVLFSLGLFITSESLIYYSVYVKPYSSDVLVTLILIFLTNSCISSGFNNYRVILLTIVGLLAIIFSFPSVFILAGILALLLYYYIKRHITNIHFILIPLCAWVLIIYVNYYLSLKTLSNDPHLISFWADYFMPLQINLAPKWLFKTFFRIFESPMGFYGPLCGIAAFFFILGCISLFVNDKSKFIFYLCPIFFTLMASALKKYPFEGRLLLFLVPIFIMIITEGAIYCKNSFAGKINPAIIVLTCLLFVWPVTTSIYYRVKWQQYYDMPKALQYVINNKQDNDILYVYHNAQYTFKYYAIKYKFTYDNVFIGIDSPDSWEKYRDDLIKLQGNKRVWIIFSIVETKDGVNEEKLFLYYLDRMGKRIKTFNSNESAVFLYDLSWDCSEIHLNMSKTCHPE